ncbi:MAG TPA: hypothetical protein DHV96_11790 [Lachnospiraceae bacterium]|nr:hypothetical protein [Lachnospiraceae bacterium]
MNDHHHINSARAVDFLYSCDILCCGSETQQKIEALKLRFSVCLWLAGTVSTTEHGIRNPLSWHPNKHGDHFASVFIHKVGEYDLERCGKKCQIKQLQ